MHAARTPATGNLLLTIRALLPALNEQEQKVGQYVLDHPAEVLYLSISDLADKCAASDATVFRFCKRMGVEGYGHLKIRLAQDLAATHSSTYDSVDAGDSVGAAAQKVIGADIKALEDTLRMLDTAALAQAVEMLLGARRVDIYGSGGGAIAALELQYKLIRVGLRGVVHTDGEMQVISATLLTAADVAIGISHSGEAPDIRHALVVARAAGARTIAITNHPASAIAVLAECSLATSAQEALAHGYPLGARVAQVALIDVLYAALALRRPEETARNLAHIGAALSHASG